MKTKEEIKALIATAIAGQGNQVDLGGKLAEILDEVVEMAASAQEAAASAAAPMPIKFPAQAMTNVSKEALASAMEITTEQLDLLFDGKVPTVINTAANSQLMVAYRAIQTNEPFFTFGYITSGGELVKFPFWLTRYAGNYMYYSA